MRQHKAFLALGMAWMLGAASFAFAETAPQAPAAEVLEEGEFEGWVVQIDYSKNQFRMLDPRGFEKRISLKTGLIGDFKIGDHVKVVMNRDRDYAESVRKLKVSERTYKLEWGWPLFVPSTS